MIDLKNIFAARVSLNEEKDELATRLKEVNQRIRELDERVIKSMEDSGMTKITINGHTVYRDQRLSVRIADPVGLRDAAATLGLENMLTMNTNSLRAFVRESYLYDENLDELVIQEDRLPECLRGVITMDEGVSVRVRKA